MRGGIYVLPSLLTLGNLLGGFYAIVSAYDGDYGRAAVAILIAGVLDALDGLVARLTGSTSDFGVQLDSLADLVSFGVAPGCWLTPGPCFLSIALGGSPAFCS